ncbi:similar to Saccharomyces cerevisiae YPR172W Protein of unknown function, transcriptionally activated by Yrm1p along with genes involved in multidrug resistance [Maudiozyma barnettii]|uniref:Pyridoxamine 5'-phosphate oxidase N-terminal domain-containing protein n=1 Tax=Maudiozyma barnettii TaxID=61262 RepID=A0A8H2VHM6_9SACH|nr:uncharacterized protein KABA2_07S00220 [Kazachstania barnettii]CAB4255600.1 similar to Saccharomyces cerevisiae YPR172W Protein of unknown function, transcriptionally activated by Yrm1p along with genes involved in multidrug resistance [Kazachstania barnettii]CAD1784160.1 similar to Saccharomyces cerevisiae YPR172W Protein of unknown function, transcriptionally activated by Yrm1p along with genes involved in multidrug resistance [Kazachstania barnettii]
MYGKLPKQLLHLIKTSKYVHIATCGNDCAPSASLMNYIYVPTDSTFETRDKNDYIIFATSRDTEKYMNILTNPTVALLFHDWVAANNLSIRKHSINEYTDETANKEKLENFLDELDDSELNQISATIKGEADFINPLGPESKYYKTLLLRANPDADVFINGENTILVKVKMISAKITDSNSNTVTYDDMGRIR